MNVHLIATRIAQASGRLYAVGGSVRDRLMNAAPKDQDYCVQGLSETEFSALFPEAQLAGKDFPVFRMSADGAVSEFALARTETKVAPGHTGFVSESHPGVTMVQDLRRRDLTINAMAIDVLTGELIDPFDGQSDIQNATLRAVSAAFAQDPLRVYRTARFAAQLGFSVEANTLLLMRQLKDELPLLSAERVFVELRRALQTIRPSIFFETLKQAGVLDIHFPELAALIGVLQPIKYHPEGDAYEHTLQVVDAAARLTPREEVRFSALLHDLGKALTPKHLWPSHHGHEAKGIDPVQSLCARLKVPTQWMKAALFATEHHMKIHHLNKMRSLKVVDLLTSVARNPLGVDGFSIVGLADVRGRNNPEAREQNADSMPSMWHECIQKVTGRSVTIHQSGSAFGEELRLARARAVDEWRAVHQSDGFTY